MIWAALAKATFSVSVGFADMPPDYKKFTPRGDLGFCVQVYSQDYRELGSPLCCRWEPRDGENDNCEHERAVYKDELEYQKWSNPAPMKP